MAESNDSEPVTWQSLPRKDQLAVLCFVRFAEPVVKVSIITYIYYQLQSLNPSQSSGDTVRQSALLQTIFNASQCATAMFWSRVADAPWGGRKTALLLGLSGSRMNFPPCAANFAPVLSIVSVLIFGFIRSFRQAAVLRLVEGAMNGNVVVARTMLSEVVREKRYVNSYLCMQIFKSFASLATIKSCLPAASRAFVLLPMSAGAAAMAAPLLAAQLADLSGRFPEKLGHIEFLTRFPYAPPALANGTLESRRHSLDYGLAFSSRVRSRFLGDSHSSYTNHRGRARDGDTEETVGFLARAEVKRSETEIEMNQIKDIGQKYEDSTSSSESSSMAPEKKVEKDERIHHSQSPRLPTRRMFTANLLCVLAVCVTVETHITTLNTVWPNMMSEPTSTQEIRLPFRFSGGAGMRPTDLAWATAFYGLVSLLVQLTLYSRVQHRLGTLRMWRLCQLGFPLLYFALPYLVVMPSTTSPPAGKQGVVFWIYLLFLELGVVATATFVIPAGLVLTNGYVDKSSSKYLMKPTAMLRLVLSSTPHPSALSRTHAIAFIATGVTRSLTSAMSGVIYAYGSSHHMTGLAFWINVFVAMIGCIISRFAREENGHSIRLPGEEELS
ncbi:major facilitator superfamily transporter [Colletotrichum incanum]|uniref:Major facilitator superfamily transporter n=1 Tax=Colletotrichum incanum TaxID=1573173 RepID=A0A167BD38_COLIC|nr:major facilitator superfamily transporter [Colletotrichum incanum]